ncbi:MAG TPA: alpha/beta fold hydrolase [Terracidiphilus sp.]|nr:alpha/beta fold hydrolase [Terracidiphilus sp.]
MKRSRQYTWIGNLLLLVVLLGAVSFWLRPVSFFRAYGAARFCLNGAHSRTVSVSGYRVHYYVLGPDSGQPVVLIHGLGGRAEDWENLSGYLTRAGYRVYLPDLPGYGQSEQPANFSYSIPSEASVVVGFLDAMHLQQVDLGGWSMGGWIVQRVAFDHPERIRHLMLFDSAGLYAKPSWNTALFTPSNIDELNQLDALLMPNPPHIPKFIARDILRHSRQNAWVIHRALGTMLAGQDVTDQLLPQLRMPVLIVWGREDHITPLELGMKMRALVPQSQLEIIIGCGHLAPSQCAPQANAAVEPFLKR